MGLDYTAIIFQKRKSTWKKIYTRPINIFKGLPTELPTANHIVSKNLMEIAGRYTEWEYVGLFEKGNTYLTLDLIPIKSVANSQDYNDKCYCIASAPFTPQIYSKESFSNLKLDLKQFEVELLNEQDLKNIETLQKENPHKKYISLSDFMQNKLAESGQYFNLYAKVEKFHQGNFYNLDSFKSLRQNFEKKYESKLKEFNKIDELKSSIEYMKLSSDEKSNFLEEYEFKKECLTEIKDVIDTCIYFENVLDYLSESETENTIEDREVIIFIYGEW